MVFDSVEFTEVLNSLNELYGDRIEKQKAFMEITDSLYNRTRIFISTKVFILLLYIISFLSQVFYTKKEKTTIRALDICYVVNILFTIEEFI